MVFVECCGEGVRDGIAGCGLALGMVWILVAWWRGEVDNGLCCGDGGCDRIVVGVLVLGMRKILAV